MDVFINISTYLFAPLNGLAELREQLRAVCRVGELKGTIMLSPEGINLFVAGTRVNIDMLLGTLRAVAGLENITPKESHSETQPFRRMLVKIKKEIIAFGVDGIDAATRTSKKISAKVLKQWLDEGKPLTLLDTRNDYEIKIGTFRGVVAALFPLSKFSRGGGQTSPELEAPAGGHVLHRRHSLWEGWSIYGTRGL